MLLALIWLSVPLGPTSAVPGREKKKPAEAPPEGVIRSEANVVLVDVIVTDKHGNDLSSLKQNDFHVFEDGKEQPITSFSYEARNRTAAAGRPEYGGQNASAANANPRRRFMVLFFDDSNMSPGQQLYERQEAVKFVENTASPFRLFAVVDFDGAIKLTQDFTDNKELLVKAIQWPKVPPYVGTRMPPEMVRILVRDRLRSIRRVGQFLGTFPGRQTLFYLSYRGIPVPPEFLVDFHETIDALNKANVGVYSIDARGLLGPSSADASRQNPGGGGAVIAIYLPGYQEVSAATGAFTYSSRNDLAAGMEKASREIDEAYILGYVQPNPLHDGATHKISVKVDRAGVVVRARESYVDTRSPDFLATQAEGKALEAIAESSAAGEIPITITKPYFFVKPGLARVNLTLSIPGADVEFKKHEDKFEAVVTILGVARRADGSVAARFCDADSLDFDRDERQVFSKNDYYHETSFKIPPGEYTFKVVLRAGGEKFAKHVVPLIVEPFSGQQLSLSGPAFGDGVVPYALDSAEVDPDKLEGSVSMNALGAEIVPSSSNQLKKDKQAVVYMEAYDPLLAVGNLHIGFLYDIVDRKTGRTVHASNTIPIDQYVRAGKPLVPVIFNLPMDKLSAGDYAIAIRVRDSTGGASDAISGYFSIK
jgi:VWFA-related protein